MHVILYTNTHLHFEMRLAEKFRTHRLIINYYKYKYKYFYKFCLHYYNLLNLCNNITFSPNNYVEFKKIKN